MDGALKKNIQVALTLGWLIFCVADIVGLHNYSPNSHFSSCHKKLIHEVDNITVIFRVNVGELTELNTSILEVSLVTKTEVVPETVTTLHKWTGLPPDDVIVQGPCTEIPFIASVFLLRCVLLVRCEMGQGHILLTMDHHGDVYKSTIAEIPKVYPMCSSGYSERKVDNYTVKIDGKELPQHDDCSMTFKGEADPLLEFCFEKHNSHISLEIARDGKHYAKSTNRCVEVKVNNKEKLTEFEFTSHDSCGVRGRLKCEFSFEANISTYVYQYVLDHTSLIAAGAVILGILLFGILICIKKRCKKTVIAKKTKKSVVQKKVPSKTSASVLDSKQSLAPPEVIAPIIDKEDQESVTIVSMMSHTLEKLLYSTDKDKNEDVTAEYKERSKLGLSGVESSVDDWYFDDAYTKTSSDGSHAAKKKTPASSTASGERSVVASVIFTKNH